MLGSTENTDIISIMAAILASTGNAIADVKYDKVAGEKVATRAIQLARLIRTESMKLPQ